MKNIHTSNTACIALTLLITAGVTNSNILSTQVAHASSSSDYQLVEDNFASTQTDGSSTNITSESEFEDIQYISEGSEATPTPLPTTNTNTSTTPTATSQTTSGSSSSSHGSGGSNPIIIDQLAGASNTSQTETGSENTDNTGNTNSTDNSSTNDTTEITPPAKIPIITSTPLPAPTHLPKSNTNTNQNRTDSDNSEETKNSENSEKSEKNNQSQKQQLGDITEIQELADESFFTGNLQTENNINTGINDEIFHNSATALPIEENTEATKNTNINTDRDRDRDKNEDDTKQTNIFCTASSFTSYALLLILFLLGMIFQAILQKTFYSNKK